jgi:hypothetical protein
MLHELHSDKNYRLSESYSVTEEQVIVAISLEETLRHTICLFGEETTPKWRRQLNTARKCIRLLFRIVPKELANMFPQLCAELTMIRIGNYTLRPFTILVPKYFI